jgi:hypothetical protein
MQKDLKQFPKTSSIARSQTDKPKPDYFGVTQ